MDYLKYSIKSVAESLGIKFYRRGSDANSAYYICPFCGSKKLNLNFKKNTWRCNKCTESGGLKKLIQLIGDCSSEEAIEFLEKNSNKFKADYSKVSFQEQKEFIETDYNLDKVYRRLLELLELKPAHIADLKKRGLSDKAIEFYQFKSLPSEKDFLIPQKLIEEGYSLKGVPGFYFYKGCWRINAFPSGFLIPFKNVNGKITGFQIKNDNPSEKCGKYMSFTSTGKREGTQSKIPAHLIGYRGQDTVYLTEGALKADVAQYLSYIKYGRKIAFMAIPGVNNTSALKKALKVLKANGVKTIVDAFDMDKIGNNTCKKNNHVANAVENIKFIVEENGLEWKHLYWKNEKGIDDFLLANKKTK